MQNVETLADLALIGRFGAEWFRTAGTPDDPGTTLVTLSGAVEKPGVCEVPLGSRLGDVLRVAGADCADLSGVLVGGYFGAWLPGSAAADVRLGVDDLRRTGGGLGAGIVVAMPRDGCVRAGRGRARNAVARRSERGAVRAVRERARLDRRRDGRARRRRSQSGAPRPTSRAGSG